MERRRQSPTLACTRRRGGMRGMLTECMRPDAPEPNKTMERCIQGAHAGNMNARADDQHTKQAEGFANANEKPDAHRTCHIERFRLAWRGEPNRLKLRPKFGSRNVTGTIASTCSCGINRQRPRDVSQRAQLDTWIAAPDSCLRLDNALPVFGHGLGAHEKGSCLRSGNAATWGRRRWGCHRSVLGTVSPGPVPVACGLQPKHVQQSARFHLCWSIGDRSGGNPRARGSCKFQRMSGGRSHTGMLTKLRRKQYLCPACSFGAGAVGLER